MSYTRIQQKGYKIYNNLLKETDLNLDIDCGFHYGFMLTSFVNGVEKKLGVTEDKKVYLQYGNKVINIIEPNQECIIQTIESNISFLM